MSRVDELKQRLAVIKEAPKIKRVEVEKPFYQLGRNYVYELSCELFEYEDEEIDTGIPEIDEVLEDVGYITDLKLVAFGGTAECDSILVPGFSGVTNVDLLNDGYNYTGIPTVTISPPGLGSPLFADVDVSTITGAVGVDEFSLTATAVAITTSVGDALSIKEIVITNTGYGYTEPPTVTIAGGGGSGAIATCVIAESPILKIEVTDKGDRYYEAPTITIDPPVGGGTTATAITRIFNGRLSEVLLTNAGSGYTSKPNITVSPPPAVGIGTYIISETVTGSLSGVTAEVKSWNNPGQDIDKILRVSLNSGTFSEGENIVGSASSAIYTLKSLDSDTSTSDEYSDNDDFEFEADKILDFTESNPFGTY